MRSRLRVLLGVIVVGGIAVGVASLVLWVAIAHELGTDGVAIVVAGVVVAAGIAAWIRLADL